MDLSRLLRLLHAGRGWVLWSIALMLCAAIAVFLLVPAKYTALASVLVDVRGVDPLSGTVTQNSPLQRSILATHGSLLRSDRVARKVVADLKLAEDPDQIAAWQDATQGRGDRVDWLAGKLLAHLDVRPAAADSNVLEIKADASHPDLAARIANGFADAYLTSLTELRSQPAKQTSAFFDEQVKPLRERLEAAQAKLTAYQREHGIVNGSMGQLDIETAQLNDLAAQLTQMRTLRIDSQSRGTQATANAGNSPDVALDPVVQQLRVQVAVSESKYKEMSGRLGPQHPQLQNAQTELNQLRRELGTAVSRAAQAVNAGGNVGAAREAQLKTALEQQRKKVLELTADRDRMQVLARDVENAQKIYDQTLQRGSQSALDQRLQFSEATLVTSAVAPVRPSSPGLPLMVVLAVVVGGAIGVLIVLLRELHAPRIRDGEDLERLDLDHLVSLEHARLTRPRHASRPGGGRKALPGPSPATPPALTGWSTT